jgi:hypothetical protein
MLKMKWRTLMRLTAFAIATCLPFAALADDMTAEGDMAMGSGIMISTSININLPILAADPAAKLAEEDGYRRKLYERSLKECEMLLESVAATCKVTGINVSTQMNTSPGQPDYLYASSTINMDVTLK